MFKFLNVKCCAIKTPFSPFSCTAEHQVNDVVKKLLLFQTKFELEGLS